MKTRTKHPPFTPSFRYWTKRCSLRESDREALLLRYYESQSLKDVGAALGGVMTPRKACDYGFGETLPILPAP